MSEVLNDLPHWGGYFLKHLSHVIGAVKLPGGI